MYTNGSVLWVDVWHTVGIVGVVSVSNVYKMLPHYYVKANAEDPRKRKKQVQSPQNKLFNTRDSRGHNTDGKLRYTRQTRNRQNQKAELF